MEKNMMLVVDVCRKTISPSLLFSLAGKYNIAHRLLLSFRFLCANILVSAFCSQGSATIDSSVDSLDSSKVEGLRSRCSSVS